MLADDVAWALPLLRAEAERLQVDSCTITRPGTGKGDFNNVTGKYDKPARVEVYKGKCRIQVTRSAATDESSGERLVITQSAEWQGPVVGTEGISVNDVIHMDSCANDSALEGREFTVVARHEKTHATSRRLSVREVTG